MRIRIFVGLVLLLLSFSFHNQANANLNLWTELSSINSPKTQSRQSKIRLMPSKYRLLKLDELSLKTEINSVTKQRTTEVNSLSIDLPMPDGKMISVSLKEVIVLPAALAKKYPDIKTYQIIDAVGDILSGRVDFTVQGFHAILDTNKGTVFIDPRENGSERVYISYYKKDYKPSEKTQESRSETVIHNDRKLNKKPIPQLNIQSRSGNQLRTYRIAVAATGEYTAFHGGTVAQGLSAIVTTINRVNQIYNRDLSINLVLVDDNDQIIYTDGGNDPYTNDNGNAMLNENVANLNTVIGNTNFDVGHVVSTNGGGVAALGVICDTDLKAAGVTGTANPINDPFDIDFVAHELGHQFSGNHIFNGVSNACSGVNRNGPTAVEPGSGSTIQGYAGICASDNLQANSDAMFSTQSIDEIIAHTVNGSGNGCAVITGNGNTAPNVNAGLDYTIPARTPFILTGSATDVNTSDTLTYSWEQFDTGPAQAVDEGDNGSSPLFRTFPPRTIPSRSFPILESILTNSTIIGETTPTTSRISAFRLTVRDQKGGVDKDSMELTIEDTGTGFEVTTLNTATTLAPGSSIDITWNEAGTSSAPISCPSVDILMSENGGETFSTTLASQVPNDGSQSVSLPNGQKTGVRIQVKCSNNIFFDINNADIIIGVAPTFTTFEDVPATPLTIDSNVSSCSGTQISRSINVSDNITINNMSFGFNADHTWRGDIQVTLVSPNSTSAVVVSSNSSDSNENYDITLNDNESASLASNSNDNTSSPFYDRGSSPSNPLSVFNGENANGTWQVSICDSFTGDSGSYNRSALIFTVDDFDGDGIPDAIDLDDDNDGAPDSIEIANSTNPLDNTEYPQPYIDVDNTHKAYTASLILTDSGIVEACDTNRFCPNQVVTHNLFAKWALKSTGLMMPPTATSSPVSDVDIGNPQVFDDGDYASDWIVEYLNSNLSFGCNGDANNPPSLYCPQKVVSRASAAYLSLRSLEGALYTPPSAAGSIFTDVDSNDFAAAWIEEIYARNDKFACETTGGNSPRRYCPQQVITRGDLSILLQTLFE